MPDPETFGELAKCRQFPTRLEIGEDLLSQRDRDLPIAGDTSGTSLWFGATRHARSVTTLFWRMVNEKIPFSQRIAHSMSFM
jgi:hypothetical protein